MEICIRRKYLVFPTSMHVSRKRLQFCLDGREVYGLNIRLDNTAPTFDAFIEMSRFVGKTITLHVEPDMPLRFREADEIDIPDLYKEPLRPQVHFTTKNGWLNDPNGLLYLNGVYHMFYQYNPAEPLWENMHWGHAVSRDLLHWEEKDVALYPDHTGTMFSGCGLADHDNLLGLQQGDVPTGILYYTTTDPFCQRMAVSTDEFATLRPYQQEPVIPRIIAENRDPKVIFCEELNCYLLALYMDGSDYSMFRSTDLVHWERFWDYQIPNDNEFPDILKFRVGDGTNKYVLTSHSDCYLVTSIQNGQFVIEQEVRRTFYESINHSPISISHVPDGRCLRMVWYTSAHDFHRERFNGEISVLEYTLDEVDGVYYLAAHPLPEMEKLFCGFQTEDNITLTADPVTLPLQDNAHLIRLQGPVVPGKILEMTLFGIRFVIDFDRNVIRACEKECPLCVVGSDMDVQLLMDRMGFEVFADEGKSCMYVRSLESHMDRNLPRIRICCKNGCYPLRKLQLHALRSIWED